MRVAICVWSYTLLVMLLCAPSAWCQVDTKKKLPEPLEVTFETKDKVTLVATYYGTPGGDDVKETVPIIMLHAFGPKHSRVAYHTLALEMQKYGHAVLVPDLRGHGASTEWKNARGQVEKLTPDKVERALPGLMLDVEECKKFLMAKHRAEHLNIDRLVIVAAEELAVVAINYTALDWSYPPLAGKKQGQDVKALVLLSPMWSFKTLNINEAVKTPAIQKLVWAYCIVGKKGKAAVVQECDRIYNMMAKGHVVDPPKDEPAKRDLHQFEAETQTQGTQMLTVANLELSKRIGKFINDGVVFKKEYNWKERPAN